MPDFPSLTPAEHGAKITSIFDFSPEVLGQLVDYITQSGIPIPISQIVGFPTQSRFLDRSTTTQEIQNDATERSVYSFSVPGGTMSTDRMLRLTLMGDMLHNNAAGDTLTFRIKFGGTTFFQSVGTNFGNVTSVNRQPWIWTVYVTNLGVPNSQMIVSTLLGTQAQSPTTGIGAVRTVATEMNAEVGVMGITTLSTIDTTATQTVDVTAQWNAASTNNSFRRRFGMFELV